jgi:hypothetical protein
MVVQTMIVTQSEDGIRLQRMVVQAMIVTQSEDGCVVYFATVLVNEI